LRIERDAADWTRIMGGHEAFWGKYLAAAAGAGMDRGAPLYVASGILSYKDADNQLADVQERWAGRGWFGWVFRRRRTSTAHKPYAHASCVCTCMDTHAYVH
jgi:hypothetical protein